MKGRAPALTKVAKLRRKKKKAPNVSFPELLLTSPELRVRVGITHAMPIGKHPITHLL